MLVMGGTFPLERHAGLRGPSLTTHRECQSHELAGDYKPFPLPQD
jgi:hypothetical protein